MPTKEPAPQARPGQSCEIVPVQCWQLGAYWEQAADWLKPAIDAYPDEGLSLERTLRLLEERTWQLWMAPKGAAVTELSMTFGRKTCSILLMGGKDSRGWLGSMLEAIESWARDNNCVRVSALGRKGWERVGARYGYHYAASVLNKGLGDGEQRVKDTDGSAEV